MKIITESIQSGVSLAYISLLQDFSEILTHPLYSHIEEIDVEIHGIICNLEEIFLSLDTLIGGEEKLRGDYASKIQDYQGILEGRYRVLNGYERELGHLAIALEEKYQLQNTTAADVQGIDYHQFTHEFLDFISQSKTDKEKKYKLAQTLRFIPMRMTKNSFLNYMGYSLQKISVGDTDKQHNHFLAIFKQLFDGRCASGYNHYFYDIGASVEDMRSLITEDLSPERIMEVFDDLHLTKDTLQGLFDIVTILHTSISNLCILLLLDDLTFDDLVDKHIAFKDFFFSIKSLLKYENYDEDYEIMLDTLPDRLEETVFEINTGYKNITNQLFDKVQNGKIPETSETTSGLKIDSLIRYYLLLDIQDIFSFDESKDKDSTLPISYVESAKEFLENRFTEMKSPERKLRMQYLISIMPFIMNDNQLATYITHGLEGTSNEVKKAYVLSKIGLFMESCGYFDDFDEHNHPMGHSHQHHEDCGCHHH